MCPKEAPTSTSASCSSLKSFLGTSAHSAAEVSTESSTTLRHVQNYMGKSKAGCYPHPQKGVGSSREKYEASGAAQVTLGARMHPQLPVYLGQPQQGLGMEEQRCWMTPARIPCPVTRLSHNLRAAPS